MQDTSTVQTYPDRVYNGKDFEPNLNMDQSSDNLTTVLTDKNEVLGFPDQTSKQEMQAAIEADRNGSISTYKPTFYDKFIAEPLRNLGMASFQPPFITDIKPTPQRAFATSMAEAATAGVFKPEFADQEAQAFPKEAMAGGLVGGLASFATGGALLDGFKLTQLTPFAEGIIKTGLLGGAYRGVAETSEQLRDSDHPDLAKIGEGVLHDTLWFGAMGATAPLAKAANVAASAGLGYLMAKTDGQDEPSALLNGALFGGIQMLHAHGDNPDVREKLVGHVQQAISDYIMAKNPLVHPEVANQAGREMVANYAEGVLQRRNGLQETGIETPQAKKIEEEPKQQFQRPEVPIEDGHDPKLLDYLSQYIPADRLVRLSGTDRVALGKAPESDLESYKQQYEQMGQIIAGEKAESNKPIVPEVEKMISEGGPVNPIDELPKSRILLTQTVSGLAKDVSGVEGNVEEKQGEVLPQEVINANSGGEGSNKSGEQTQGLVGQEKASNDLRGNEKTGMEAGTGEEVNKGTSKEQGNKITPEDIEKKYKGLSDEERTTFKEQAKLASDLINTDIDKARRILRGEEPLPGKLQAGGFLSGMEEYLKKNPNDEIMNELADTNLYKENISKGAQATSLSRMLDENSFSSKMNEINNAKEEAAGGDEKVAKETKKRLDVYKKETSKVNLSKDELKWDKFLDDEVAC